MTSSHFRYDEDPQDDEHSGTLLAAVQATVARHADEAPIRRVIERASRLPSPSPVDGAEAERALLGSRRALTLSRRVALAASWSGVAATVVGLAVGLSMVLGNRVAFAQVQQQLADVHTIQFVFRSMDSPNQQPGRVFIVEPNRYREELPDGRVFVTDLQSKQIMQLDRKSKTAEIYSLYRTSDRERRTSSLIATLRDAPANSVQIIGRRRLDGEDVIDYRVVDLDGTTLKVTAEAATKLPIRIVRSSPGNENATMVASDFVFDQPIDDTLVRITPPDDYQITEVKSKGHSDTDTLVVSSAGLGPVKWGMKTADVVKLLGDADGIKPFSVSNLQDTDGKEKPIGKKNGEELIYESRGFRIIVDANAGVETIMCYGDGQLGDRARGFTGRTSKGIRIGATPSEVRQVYGEPERRHGMTADLPNGGWSYVKDGLSFQFFDNAVSQIQILGPRLRPNARGIITVEIK